MSRKDKKKRDKQAPPPTAEAPTDTSAGEPAGERAEPAPMDLQAERDDLLARLQRLGADYQNYQKRVQRDTEQARTFANEELIKALLSVLDDMERALDAARENHSDDDPLLAGMQLVHDKALETLGRFGLSVVEAEGKPFDPECHSAMMQQPSDEHPPRTVLRELQKGYQLRGRTLRPAAVIVSIEPQQDAEAPDASGEKQ